MSTDILLGVAGIVGLGVTGYFLYDAMQTDTMTGGPQMPPGAAAEQQYPEIFQPSTIAGAATQSCPNGMMWAKGGGTTTAGDVANDGCIPIKAQGSCGPGYMEKADGSCMSTRQPCIDGYTWDVDSKACRPILEGTKMGTDFAQQSKISNTAVSQGMSTAYANYNDYVKKVESAAVDSYGCFDSQYTTHSASGQTASVKVCGDAQSCYMELYKDPTDELPLQLSDWGKVADQGLATCGVLGGAQTGTITIMNASQVKDYYTSLDLFGRGTDLTAESMQTVDYSAWGTTIDWDTFTASKATFDKPAATTATFPPGTKLMGPLGIPPEILPYKTPPASTASCAQTRDIPFSFWNSWGAQQKKNFEVLNQAQGVCVNYLPEDPNNPFG